MSGPHPGEVSVGRLLLRLSDGRIGARDPRCAAGDVPLSHPAHLCTCEVYMHWPQARLYLGVCEGEPLPPALGPDGFREPVGWRGCADPRWYDGVRS